MEFCVVGGSRSRVFAGSRTHLHANIKRAKLPARHRIVRIERRASRQQPKLATWSRPPPGRVMFNTDAARWEWTIYNLPLRSGELAMVISDCYQVLGRRETINLLDNMNQLGFRESTRSGLSFATDDLVTPDSKVKDHRRSGKDSSSSTSKLYTTAASSPTLNGTTRCWTRGRTLANKSRRK